MTVAKLLTPEFNNLASHESWLTRAVLVLANKNRQNRFWRYRQVPSATALHYFSR
ncbi:MAG: hypothetical protein WCA10_17055 [Terracidiphilus sp.]